ncbi:ABC transporter permease [Pelagibacterium nitratireducens]|jgi:ABC-2 type transport system permease protein|uniref:Transport permease protein n=1 Tax=Pelagibacterium nitratireducens TaxID=1046114 RepID=A0ABZ2I835_9HYPH
MIHAARALRGIVARELVKFMRQYGRLASALVRPALWLVVFAAGMQNLFGVSPIEPYETYIPYQEYIVPGLLGIVLLFNGMQSSLSLVYDREIGTMRLLLTAPLPRWYLLLCKLIAGTLLSVVQCYAFLVVAHLIGVRVPWSGWAYVLPALVVCGFMLGAIGLLLSIAVRQLENFAGTMNFVIFPMFFLSSALYPLWRLRESGAQYLYIASSLNPFTHAVELVRYAAYGKFNGLALAVVAGAAIVCFFLAVIAYDPQIGLIRRRPRA